MLKVLVTFCKTRTMKNVHTKQRRERKAQVRKLIEDGEMARRDVERIYHEEERIYHEEEVKEALEFSSYVFYDWIYPLYEAEPPLTRALFLSACKAFKNRVRFDHPHLDANLVLQKLLKNFDLDSIIKE